MKKFILALSGMVAALVLVFGAAPFASAETTTMYKADLSSLNNSGATGSATVSVTGDQATVTITESGASANLPHAQHIHIGGSMSCPTMSDDADNDGVLTTVEGQPSYGTIKVSLTTDGDVTSASGLAVDRFPTANNQGIVTYSRTFTLPEGVSAADIADGVIVTHGVASITGSATAYDGTMKSELDSSLPEEATAPSACGKLVFSSSNDSGSSMTTGTATYAYVSALGVVKTVMAATASAALSLATDIASTSGVIFTTTTAAIVGDQVSGVH